MKGVFIGAALLLGPGAAHALGTCGSGGPTGRHVNVKFDPSEYWVWAPPHDPMKPYPLVLAMHGDEGSPEGSQRVWWDPVWMTEQNLIVVTPRAAYGGGSWYAAWAMNELWLNKLLADVFAKYNVDIDRIYATGDSGGSEILSGYGLKKQHIFAAVQWSCGGIKRGYDDPPRDDCKLAGRFVISPSDKLYAQAKGLEDLLKSKGHTVQWDEQTCSGHCCGPFGEYGAGAWKWMKTKIHCGALTGPGCGMVGDLPGAAPTPRPEGSDGSAEYSGTGGAGGTGGQDAAVGGGGGGGGGSGGNANGNPTKPDGGVQGGCVVAAGRRAPGTAPLLAIAVAFGLFAGRRRSTRAALVALILMGVGVTACESGAGTGARSKSDGGADSSSNHSDAASSDGAPADTSAPSTDVANTTPDTGGSLGRSCDPATQDCPAGAMCGILCPSDGTAPGFACIGESGTTPAGGSCSAAMPLVCGKGTTCLVTASTGKCHKYCKKDEDCSSGQTCMSHNVKLMCPAASGGTTTSSFDFKVCQS